MARRRGEIQVFSVSFLDVISCALGGVLLVLILTMNQSQQQAQAQQRESSQLRSQIQSAMGKLDAAKRKAQEAQKLAQQAQKDAQEAKDKAKAAESQADTIDEMKKKYAQAIQDIEEAEHELIGFRGELKNVVFVFDTSGSMATVRFDDYVNYLKSLVQYVSFENFNVIRYSSTFDLAFTTDLAEKNDANVNAAKIFIDSFAPEGGTGTGHALQKALDLQGVDTIVLFSDGAPTGYTADEIIEKFGDLAIQRGVVINTVAMGSYLQVGQTAQPYAVFLNELAKKTGGRWIPFD